MMKTGIIGVGNMGFAIAKGLRKSHPHTDIAIMDTDNKKAEEVSKTIRGEKILSGDYKAFCEYADIIILAVKPQYLDNLFKDLAEFTGEKKIISIAAGKTIKYFEEKTGSTNIIRFMPNIAATVGESIVAVAYGEKSDQEFRQEAMVIAESIGKALPLAESQMSAFTGLSGSGIAYVFSFIHALALGGTEQGIPYNESLEIAIQTVNGATALLSSGMKKENPIELLTRVISAGGTTIAGVKALENGKLTSTVMEAVKKASARARELED